MDEHNNLKDLIRRARELAALAEKATPGPWEWRRWGLFSRGAQRYVLQSEANPDCEQRPVAENESDYDLIAASPEMARLLGQLADVVEDTCSVVPMFIVGDVPQEIAEMREKHVSVLLEGGDSRWSADLRELANAAYESGWDDAVLYISDRVKGAGVIGSTTQAEPPGQSKTKPG